MAHCNQTDCIGCFGAECQSVMNGQCYTLSGVYCGDCHDCFDEDITTNNRNNRNQGGGHTHNYNTGPGSGQVDYFGNTYHASIGQHTHRITSNSIPPHTHPINPNEQGHYSSRMMVEDVWEGGPPMTVNDAIDRHGYDPSLQNGTHNHHNAPRVNRPPVPTSGQGGGTQNNLRTRAGQFRNRRTGQPVRANQPYHTHNGQAMAGARHSNRPHDKYDRVGGRQMSQPHHKKYLHGEGVCPIGHTWNGTTCVPVHQDAQSCTKEVTQCWYQADWHECGHHYYSPHEGEWVNECEDCTLTLNGQKPYHDMNHTDCCVQTVQYLDFWPFTTDGFTGDACNHNGPYNEDPCRPQNGGSGGFCWMGTGCCYYEGGE